jgi:hypothetical protein
MAPSLFGRPHCHAVEEEVIATLFQHGDPDVAVIAGQEPHLAALDPRAVILLGQERDVTRHGNVGGDIGVALLYRALSL